MGKAEVTRARLVEAATEEFARHGVAGARVDRIAGRAAINKAQLYAYFGGKDALFEKIFDSHVLANVDRVPLTADDLPGYAQRLFDAYLHDPTLVRLATWARLERVPAGDLMDTDGTWAENVARIAAAQHDGVVVDDVEPDDLFRMVIALAMTWAQSSITATATPEDPPEQLVRRRHALGLTVRRGFCTGRS